MSLRRVALLAGLAALPGSLHAAPGPRLVTERAVLVMRHGIRSPLAGEVPEGTRTGAAWPTWPVAESRITPHGARGLAIVAAADRRLLVAHGLPDSVGCPAPGAVRIRTNNSDRTIASGQAYAEGWAADCAVPIEHKPLSEADPIFEPLRARSTRFDADKAVASITRETGGAAALAGRLRTELALLDDVLGCHPNRTGCVPSTASSVVPGADGHDIVLSGPIRATSGIAQVLLLEYAEGLPRPGLAGNAAGTLKQLGALHAALFAVFTHPAYMAAHQASVLGRGVLASLSDRSAATVTVLMGHDTNVTALAAALRVELKAPGYATNDVPPEGALLLERVRDTRSGRSYIRVLYRTRSLAALREGKPDITLTSLQLPGCGAVLCRTETFTRVLLSHLAKPIEQNMNAM